MKEKEVGGMKSALELAMERMDGGGVPAALSREQKEKLAEVERGLKAGIAEVEIMSRQGIVEARAQGDVERLKELEEGRRDEIRRLSEKAEKKKREIREAKA